MNNSMYMNSDNLKSLASQLNEKIKKLESIYNDINEKYKAVDGNSDVWTGSKQKKFYEFYMNSSRKYPETIERLNTFYTFLCGTIEEYEKRDKDISNLIDTNANNLDIN